MRLWSTIPASSRITVVSGPTWSLPLFARTTRASSVNVCPSSAGLPTPSRSAVEPDTATPNTSRPASCSARAAASITTPFPVPAGPISTARRSGPVTARRACSCSRGQGCADALRDLPARSRSRPLADVAAGRLARARRARRSIACSWARTASVVILPPSKVRMRRSPTIARVTAIASSGPSSPADCSSATARSSPASNIASRSVSVASMRSSIARSCDVRQRGTDQVHRLIRSEPVALPCLRPHALQIATGRQVLRAAVLQRDVADLPAFGCTAVLGAETLRGPARSHGGALRTRCAVPPAPRRSRSTCRPCRCPARSDSPLRQLLRERRAVERADLPQAAEDRPGGDRDDAVVLADRAGDHDMGVQLRVRRLGAASRPSRSCGGRRSRSRPWPAPPPPVRRSGGAPPAPAPSGIPSTARPPWRAPPRSARAATGPPAPTPPTPTSGR